MLVAFIWAVLILSNITVSLIGIDMMEHCSLLSQLYNKPKEIKIQFGQSNASHDQ